jgi:hypothetical protein
MVELSREGRNIRFEVLGLHKIWAFKSTLLIPREHIVNVYQDEHEITNLSGIRALGTSIPFLFLAGTIFTNDGVVFCDVFDRKNAIIIALKHEYYNKLIIEVSDPQESIYFLAKQ